MCVSQVRAEGGHLGGGCDHVYPAVRVSSVPQREEPAGGAVRADLTGPTGVSLPVLGQHQRHC